MKKIDYGVRVRTKCAYRECHDGVIIGLNTRPVQIEYENGERREVEISEIVELNGKPFPQVTKAKYKIKYAMAGDAVMEGEKKKFWLRDTEALVRLLNRQAREIERLKARVL